MASRGYGRGTVFQRKSDGLWVGRVTQRGVALAVFTSASQAAVEARLDGWLTAHRPDRMAPAAPRRRMPREDYLIAARAIASHTEAEWAALCQAAQGRCCYCRRPAGVAPHKEHKMPVSRGGSDGIDNLALACADCNMAKGQMTVPEFLAYADETGFFRKPRRRAVRRPFSLNALQ